MSQIERFTPEQMIATETALDDNLGELDEGLKEIRHYHGASLVTLKRMQASAEIVAGHLARLIGQVKQ